MSFSSKVKEELAEQIPAARHCMLAELAAITAICGRTETDETGEKIVHIHTENAAVARKYFTLLEKTFNIGSILLSVVIRKKEVIFIIFSLRERGCRRF